MITNFYRSLLTELLNKSLISHLGMNQTNTVPMKIDFNNRETVANPEKNLLKI